METAVELNGGTLTTKPDSVSTQSGFVPLDAVAEAQLLETEPLLNGLELEMSVHLMG